MIAVVHFIVASPRYFVTVIFFAAEPMASTARADAAISRDVEAGTA
jgi:hypothetical protein